MKDDVLRNYAQKAKRRLVGRETMPSAKIKVISNEDNDFKSRVEDLLSREELITNPVQYLIDNKVFNNLSETERERYLLATLDKYNSLKNKLEHLSSDSRFCM